MVDGGDGEWNIGIEDKYDEQNRWVDRAILCMCAYGMKVMLKGGRS